MMQKTCHPQAFLNPKHMKIPQEFFTIQTPAVFFMPKYA
jgi:hypothetical protein